ncbi:MAG: hypothetical protein KZQ66_05195 [Candidatus Thiodiazotropha sp. (ex Lucinoma aequizonata)]|nr:hypothetical protein [Candidatus Thiodiazotropha sp. (ex Lucinoma aequizonata)]
MRDKDLYAQILGIKSPWQVTSVELAVSDGNVPVHVEQKAWYQAVLFYLWRDLSKL